MTASTAPTQPPDKCPVCGAKVTSVSADGFIEFACGKMQRISDGVYGSMCHNAEAAAVTLRAERDDLQAMYQRAWTEIGELRAERDAALAQVKMFSDNEGGALTFHILRTWDREKLERFCLHLLGDDWQTLTARAEKAEGERDGVMARNQYMADELILIRDILRGAEIEIDDEDSVANGVSVLASCDKEEIKRADLWYGEYMTKSELLESTEAELSAAHGRLVKLQAVCDAAQAVADDVCSALCPSVKKTGTEWTHVEKCVNLRAALASGAQSD